MADASSKPDNPSATAPEVWAMMSDLVLDHSRRREVSEALGMSFARVRAIRRIARRPMSMKELATMLGIEQSNATSLVDDLERLGLARRRPHPEDRRAKLVEATSEGEDAARRADVILLTPPPGLTALAPEELSQLAALLRRAGGAGGPARAEEHLDPSPAAPGHAGPPGSGS